MGRLAAIAKDLVPRIFRMLAENSAENKAEGWWDRAGQM